MAASETRVAEADASFEQLYRTHRRDVYNFVLHDVRNPDEAEDVTQVAFLNAYRALRGGRPPEKPRAWLLTIAQNVSRRRFRRRAFHFQEVPLDTELAVAAPDDYDGPTADEIHAAFRALPESQRTALAMRELQGHSYAEIASALELSVPAVETLIFRARRALRAQLEPEESRLRGLLTLPLALPATLAKALGSAASSIGRAGLVTRTAGVVGALVIGGAAVEFVPPLLAAEEPPAVEQVAPLKSLAPPLADEPRPAAAHAARDRAEPESANGGAVGGTDAGAGAGEGGPDLLGELPQLEVPQLPLPDPGLTVPDIEVPSELPELEVPQVPLPPAPPPPELDTDLV